MKPLFDLKANQVQLCTRSGSLSVKLAKPDME